jgi:hypothetical protein
LLAAGRRQGGGFLGDQAELAPEPDRQLAAPAGGGPQGVRGERCMGRHMRFLARLDRRKPNRGGTLRCLGS